MIRSSIASILAVAIALLAQAPNPAHAAQSYDNCTGFITSLPTVISTQGTWCLKNDLATSITSGNAITVASNNVTIDCNDFKIGGLAAGAGTQANGIYGSDRLNTTVRRCNIRGFVWGLRFDDSGLGGGHVVENDRFDNNTFVGIKLAGDGSVVRQNRILDTGGSTVYTAAQAIETFGDVDVIDNSISGVTAASGGNDNANGIYAGMPGGSISGNRVRGLVKDGTGVTYAIYVDNSSGEHVALRENDVSSAATGGYQGIYCANAAGRAKDNIVGGFTNNFVGCSDDGGNVLSP